MCHYSVLVQYFIFWGQHDIIFGAAYVCIQYLLGTAVLTINGTVYAQTLYLNNANVMSTISDAGAYVCIHSNPSSNPTANTYFGSTGSTFPAQFSASSATSATGYI
jgi:hypothetical protein